MEKSIAAYFFGGTMRRKIKYEQYLVRGKHRYYHILKLPAPEYAWIYDAPPDEGEVALDGDERVFRTVGAALSLLTINPTKIIYLPKSQNGHFYFKQRELVITRKELQLRRSEWVSLRRQISKRTRIENFVYCYDEEQMLRRYKKYAEPYWYKYKEQGNVREVLGDTGFWTLSRYSCLDSFYSAIRRANEKKDEYSTFTSLGYILTERGIYNVTHNYALEDVKR